MRATTGVAQEPRNAMGDGIVIADNVYRMARAGHVVDLERSSLGDTLPDMASSLGSTPLVGAVAGNDFGAASVLLQNGADPNVAFDDADQPSLLHYVAWVGTDEMMALLLSHGARVDVLDHDGNTPLLNATKADASEKIRLLVDNGANPNHRTNDGETALHRASQAGRAECVDELIAGGADINARRTSDGSTALHLASFLGHERVVRLLIRDGANIDARDNDGNTPLHEAAIGGYSVSCVDDLLRAGSHIEALNSDGMTALWCAAAVAKDVRVLRALLAAGADVNAKSPEGVTPLICAVRKPAFAIALLCRGADVKAVGGDGQTALHLAACWGHLGVVKRLIAAGVNVHARDRFNMTPYDYACRFGRSNVAELLGASK